MTETRPEQQVMDRERFVPAELGVYRLSPFGFVGTTLLIFLVAFGSFVAIAEITGRPSVFETIPLTEDLSHTGGRPGFAWQGQYYLMESEAWVGFVLSLILTAALALSENGRWVWKSLEQDLVAALPAEGEADARAFIQGAPRSWRHRYRTMFAIGIVGGLAFNILMMFANGIPAHLYLNSIGLWFTLFTPFLFALGIRAGVDVSRESGELRRLIHTYLDVDLFHLDRQTVFGNLGQRGALSWALMAAIVLLFVADRTQIAVALPTLALSIFGGIFIFGSAVNPVHRRIRDAKQAELVRIHEEMAKCRERALSGDADAASALAGLTDYEQWIEQRPEWPLSPTVTQRFALYILIPIIPIVASYVFEKTADLVLTGAN